MPKSLFSIECTSRAKHIIKKEELTNTEICKILSKALVRVSNNEFILIKREREGKEQIKFYAEGNEIIVKSTVNIWNTIYVISEILSLLIMS